ncbi:peptidylprolyl isomerase [Nitrospirales bacterium NOB]|nr:peptidylprolyl isomerase [Nitrospira sp. NTP2]MDL1889187.1 peptidylprolyl isomerase [Nitrospirales bacterium NOB]QOJ37145.1 MAG: peptidylprolyl isomerase [Nitrospira sp.]
MASGLSGVGFAADPEAVGRPLVDAKNVRAIIKTKFGEMEIKFFPDVAPKHVDNFIQLAKSGFYNGTVFHRVIPGFMIQGGDPNTKDSLKKGAYGQGGPGHNVKAEFSDLAHKRGMVSMARAQDPDSAGSQFFIVVEDSRFLDRKYTIFGEVVKGIGVADKIVGVPRVLCQTGAPNPPDKGPCDNPIDRVEMTVTISE